MSRNGAKREKAGRFTCVKNRSLVSSTAESWSWNVIIGIQFLFMSQHLHPLGRGGGGASFPGFLGWPWLPQDHILLGPSPGKRVPLLTCSDKNPKASLSEPNWLGLSMPALDPMTMARRIKSAEWPGQVSLPPLQVRTELILPQAQGWEWRTGEVSRGTLGDLPRRENGCREAEMTIPQYKD